MTEVASQPDIAAKHPAPHRGRVTVVALFVGLVAGPAVWILHHVVNYGLASHGCFPERMPLHHVLPGWGWLWPALLVIVLLSIAATVFAGLVSLRAWRATRDELGDMSGQMLDIGEGRTRFMAAAGLITSALILATIVFEAIPLFVVPLCRG